MGSRRARRQAARPPLAVVTYATPFAATAARVSGRRISGYQCRRLNGLRPFRCPPPPAGDLGACAEERARYLLGGPLTHPVYHRWWWGGNPLVARGVGAGGGGGRDPGGGPVDCAGRQHRRGGPWWAALGAMVAGDTWWRGRAATKGAATPLGAGGLEPRGRCGKAGLPIGRGGPAPLPGWDRLKLTTEIALANPAVACEFAKAAAWACPGGRHGTRGR